jgi:periplasmic copper chaperone A
MRDAILILAAALAVSSAAIAAPGAIVVSDAEVRASLGGSTNTAAYLTISNTGSEPDRLVSVVCACAAHAEAHATGMKGQMMTMAPAGPVVVPAHGKVTFAPGGLHLMLTGLKAPLVDGRSQEMTLRFERAGEVRARFQVHARIVGGAMGGMQGMGDMPGMQGMHH